MLQNEEAFEDGMNQKIAETEDKNGIEKQGVYIHADTENAVKSGNIEEVMEDNMKMEMAFFLNRRC